MHCYLLDIQHTPGSSVSLNRLAEYMYVAKLPCNTVTYALTYIINQRMFFALNSMLGCLFSILCGICILFLPNIVLP